VDLLQEPSDGSAPAAKGVPRRRQRFLHQRPRALDEPLQHADAVAQEATISGMVDGHNPRRVQEDMDDYDVRGRWSLRGAFDGQEYQLIIMAPTLAAADDANIAELEYEAL
jgi:hypothetical protein